MPLNVRRSFATLFLVLVSSILGFAQTAPTSAEIMRGRISKAKAFIAVKNYNAAIYELENIRRETGEPTVNSVLNVLLMNCYLEQGDYKRAQDFLGTLFNEIKTNKPNANSNYYAAAGQVIKGARNQSDRYKSLGLTVSDRNLPPEAVTDLENMRATLEKVVEQSKTLGKDTKQMSNAMALLEETTSARSLIARDDYDSKRWKDEIADSREMLATSRSTVMNAVNDSQPDQPVALNTVSQTPAATTNPVKTLPIPGAADDAKPTMQPVKESVPAPETVAKNDVPKKIDEPSKEASSVEGVTTVRRERRVVPEEPKSAVTENSDPNGLMNVGSLLEFAVQKTNPIYPPTARSMRQTGVVRLEILVDENGKVAEVQNTSGPSLLQSAAKDAVRKWKFKPFTRDGQPVKATGYVSFNFNL